MPKDQAEEHLEQQRIELAQAMSVDRESAERLDRITLVGSAAAVLASITFLRDIAPTSARHGLLVLRASWIALLLSGATSISSLVCARLAARTYVKILREKIEQRKPEMNPVDCDPMRRMNSSTKWLNGFALGFFAVGVVLLAIFANLNF